MKKLVLLFLLLNSVTFGQIQYPIAPGCEHFQEKIERIKCFNAYTADLLKTYFYVNSNVYQYFRLPSLNEKVNFQVGTSGEFRFKPHEGNSLLMNHLASDVFYFFNRIQELSNRKIIPAKTGDGRPAILSFNIPINLPQNKNFKYDNNKNPILFTVPNGNYVVRLGEDYSFHIYKLHELISTVYSIKDFYDHEILKPLTENVKNLIVEKKVKGKIIKLEVENLFKNQQGEIKISYFENEKLIKEFSNMEDFLTSSYSNHIY
ncbi:MAG TPA: hypothetical protein VIG94_06350 [Faecalibacter sp.]